MCHPGDDPELVANFAGPPIEGSAVKIINDKGAELAANEPGEVLVRGYNLMTEYYDDPEATAEAIDAEGWLHTGDIGILNEAGYVKITDRKKDMIITGGFNVSPAEVERVLFCTTTWARPPWWRHPTSAWERSASPSSCRGLEPSSTPMLCSPARGGRLLGTRCPERSASSSHYPATHH